MDIKKLINWKLYFILLTASILSVIAVLPYVLTLQADTLQNIPIPLPLALFLSVIQSSIMLAIVLFIGLKISKKLGLKIPLIEGYINKEKIDTKPLVKNSILYGIFVGVIIIFLDIFFLKLGVNLGEAISAPIWQGFLASFYGGIVEEIFLRLFFMSLIIWIFSKLKGSRDIIKNKGAVWSSIIMAAILFGVGHLPATAALTSLTPIVIFRALFLNGIGGIVFGWLYWKNGLESAMIAHFSADIILHVLFPLVLLL